MESEAEKLLQIVMFFSDLRFNREVKELRLFESLFFVSRNFIHLTSKQQFSLGKSMQTFKIADTKCGGRLFEFGLNVIPITTEPI